MKTHILSASLHSFRASKPSVFMLIVGWYLHSTAVYGGEWQPRDVAILNMASGYAFSVQCSKKGYVTPESVAELSNLYAIALTDSANVRFRDVFQNALHEKKIYSIAKNRWYPYTISEKECSGVQNATNMFIARMRIYVNGSAREGGPVGIEETLVVPLK